MALRLQEDSFVTGFPPGWRFMKVWETATRQDAELLVHVFRASCKDYLPGGSTGTCELVSLPLQTIVRVMELIIAKASASKRILLSHVKAREIFPQPTNAALGSAAAGPSATFLSLNQGSSSATDTRPLRAHLHYHGGSSVLSPERDNYRFLVLWEELDDAIRLDAGDILRDCEGWMAANDAAKAAASAAAEAHAADEAKTAIETNAASRAKARAEADAAAEQLRHRFCAVQQELQNSQKELQDLRLRVAAVVSKVTAANCPSNLAIEPNGRHNILFDSWAAIELNLGAAADSSLALTQAARVLAGNSREAAVDLTAAKEEPPKDDDEQHRRSLLSNAVVAVDAHAIAATYKERRQQSALRSKSSGNGRAS